MVLRVVSLLPSATEIVALILEHAPQPEADRVSLVGRSHECDYPASLSHLPVLTAAKTKFTTSLDVENQVRAALAAGKGLYSVDKELLQALQPDVIITQAEPGPLTIMQRPPLGLPTGHCPVQSVCSVCSVDYCLVQSIAHGLSPQPRVVDLNPASIQDVLADVERIGEALGLPRPAAAAASALRQRVEAAVAVAARHSTEPLNCAFVEWTEPIYPGGHWTPQLIHMAGGTHAINPPKTEGGPAGPSAPLPPEALLAAAPDWLIIGPCGLDLTTTKCEVADMATKSWWPEIPAVQKCQVFVIDGNQYFNRPGPRLVDALEFLVSLLHGQPELSPPGFLYERWE